MAELAPTGFVSVVLPTHERPQTLGRAMTSVLAQLHDALELIVVDDASGPETRRVVERFADSRVRYVRLERNQGAAAARNEGVRVARGSLIAFQDDDDVWLIEKLSRQVQYLAQRPEIGWCVCGHYRLNPHGVVPIGMDAHMGSGWDFARGPLGGFGVIATPGWLVRRVLFEQAGGFDSRLRSWDDWELGCRLARHGAVGYLDEMLFIQDRVHGGQMWRNRAAYAPDMEIILAKHGELWFRRPRLLARQYDVLGRSQAAFHSTRKARAALWQSLRLDPRRVRTWLALLATLGGSATYRMLQRGWSALRT